MRSCGKTDPVSNAIRDRLTQQFSHRYDEKTAIEAGLQAIDDAAPLPATNLSLIDELPYAPDCRQPRHQPKHPLDIARTTKTQ